MAVSLSLKVDGLRELDRRLLRISPRRNPRMIANALIESALLVQDIAASKKIKRGGVGPPVPGILTSRTGTLRRSIAVDRRPIPLAIEIGSNLIYARVHELGGRSHPPRPFLKPALEDASREIGEIFAKHLGRAAE